MAELILVTGPARSGKSEWAEHWANQINRPVVYIATSTIDKTDVEWTERIERHRRRRPQNWETWEVPKALTAAIQAANPDSCLLIDSLGTWLANWLDADDAAWQTCVDELLVTLNVAACDIILVAEETGWGLVPDYPIGRLFRDRLGSLVRQIGQIATQVYLITGGYALDLQRLGSSFPAQ